MRVIIPCGGDGSRWSDYTGGPKQLIFSEGMTLLERMVGLLRKYTEDIWVITEDGRIRDHLVGEVTFDSGKKFSQPVQVDKVMCSECLWLSYGETVILFGDVFCTPETVRLLMEEGLAPLTFYGRLEPSELTGKTSPEIYGLKFTPNGQNVLRAHCEYIREAVHSGELDPRRVDYIRYVLEMVEGKGVLELMNGNTKYLVRIDDWTEDFDRPKDWVNWKRRRRCHDNVRKDTADCHY